MRAYQVLDLLLYKHQKDVCVPECGTGSNWVSGNYGRFDLWVMAKSWTAAKYIGYEIKVSRSDFLQDNKWPKYLAYCTQFYWVCPHGLIDKKEVPEGTGLIYVSKAGTKLTTRLKAPVRKVKWEDVAQVFKYILMSRVKITSSTFRDPLPGLTKQQRFNKMQDRFLAEHELKVTTHTWGLNLGKRIRESIKTQIEDVQTENRKLRDESELALRVKRILEEELDIKIDELPKYANDKHLKDALGVGGEKLRLKVHQKIEDLITDLRRWSRGL